MGADAADDEEFRFLNAGFVFLRITQFGDVHFARRVDFGEKLSAYASIDTLQEYVILARDEPRVTLFRRAAGWRPEHLDGRDTLMLKSVGMTLSVSKIYRNTTSSTD